MEVLLLCHRCFFFSLPPHVALGTSKQQGSFGTLAAGQLIGARIGSNPARIYGTCIIRPLFLTVILLMISRLTDTTFTH